MEALSYEAGFYTLTKTLGDWRNTRVKWNARTAMKEGLKKTESGVPQWYSMYGQEPI